MQFISQLVSCSNKTINHLTILLQEILKQEGGPFKSFTSLTMLSSSCLGSKERAALRSLFYNRESVSRCSIKWLHFQEDIQLGLKSFHKPCQKYGYSPKRLCVEMSSGLYKIHINILGFPNQWRKCKDALTVQWDQSHVFIQYIYCIYLAQKDMALGMLFLSQAKHLTLLYISKIIKEEAKEYINWITTLPLATKI